MKRLLVAALASLFLFAGCSATSGSAPTVKQDDLNETHVRLHDGSQVTCLVYQGDFKGGLSCDWEGAR